MSDERTDGAGDGQPRVDHHPDRNRYEILADGVYAGHTAYVDDGERRIFYHTEIDERFEGRGLGSRLLAAALADARSGGRRIVAVCPFVARYVARHHEFDDILDPATPAAFAAVQAAARG